LREGVGEDEEKERRHDQTKSAKQARQHDESVLRRQSCAENQLTCPSADNDGYRVTGNAEPMPSWHLAERHRCGTRIGEGRIREASR
jgi:hypothetical protein